MARMFGYARVSSDGQDLTAQSNALQAAGCDSMGQHRQPGCEAHVDGHGRDCGVRARALT